MWIVAFRRSAWLLGGTLSISSAEIYAVEPGVWNGVSGENAPASRPSTVIVSSTTEPSAVIGALCAAETRFVIVTVLALEKDHERPVPASSAASASSRVMVPDTAFPSMDAAAVSLNTTETPVIREMSFSAWRTGLGRMLKL
jgi:hypothetical protein